VARGGMRRDAGKVCGSDGSVPVDWCETAEREENGGGGTDADP
jgi:hypothetical protein